MLLASPERDPCTPLTEAQYHQLDEFPDRPIDASGPGLWIGGIAFVPADLESAIESVDSLSEEWGVEVTFTPSGQAKFREAQRCGVNVAIEISVDGRLISRPILRQEILGNVVRIDGGFDEESATAMARRLVPD